MNQPIVLTVIADDQPGIVRTVSEVLKSHGGSWSQSSMSHLAGQFAGILLAQVPSERVEDCLAALQGLEARGITIIARPGEAATSEPARGWTLELVGNDRPGIVHEITQVLAAHGVSVHRLDTGVAGASMAGGELFRARAELQVPESCDPDALAQALEDLANDLMVDLSVER